MSVPESAWLAWCDGTAAPNPGRIGLGVVLVAPDGARYEISHRAARLGCNNEAELLALAEALSLALEHGARRLCVTVDSRVAADYVNGCDSTTVPRIAALVDAIRARVTAFVAVELRWRPRRENPDADRLARAALGLPEKPGAQKKRRRR